jgi:hypothetical protein
LRVEATATLDEVVEVDEVDEVDGIPTIVASAPDDPRRLTLFASIVCKNRLHSYLLAGSVAS